jgi:outer membrane biogenesis lipoprotein LolB
VIPSSPAVVACRAAAAAVLGVCLLVSGCAPKTADFPTGGGAPLPDAASAYNEATSQCRGVRTLSAELALSGRAGRQKLRGRVLGGFSEPGRVRLEAPAPFGRPVFTLVVRDGMATLVLNRDRRVVRDAPPAALVEALTGVALGPDELRAVIAGCGVGVDEVSSGQSYPGDWVAIQGAQSKSWLRRVAGTWRLVANARDALEIRYDEFASGRPSVVRLRSTPSQGAATDLTLRPSQVEINVPLGGEVFQVEIPDDATPLSLQELRRAGPLGEGSARSTRRSVDGVPASLQ